MINQIPFILLFLQCTNHQHGTVCYHGEGFVVEKGPYCNIIIIQSLEPINYVKPKQIQAIDQYVIHRNDVIGLLPTG